MRPNGGSGGAPEGRVKDIVLEGIGHLVAMEAVGACADGAADWISKELQRWRKEEEEFIAEWRSKPKLEKQTISEEWKTTIRSKAMDRKPASPSKL